MDLHDDRYNWFGNYKISIYTHCINYSSSKRIQCHLWAIVSIYLFVTATLQNSHWKFNFAIQKNDDEIEQTQAQMKVELKGMKDKITGMERTQSGMIVRQDYSYNFLVLCTKMNWIVLCVVGDENGLFETWNYDLLKNWIVFAVYSTSQRLHFSWKFFVRPCIHMEKFKSF
jgi:hypothetical protein